VEAARQCGRGDIPAIAAPASFEEALREVSTPALRLCLDPAARRPFGAALSATPRAAVAFAVGPEGGLSDEELAAAEQAGFARVALGPLVLRTETVCAAVLGALLALGGPPETELVES
jgi:16S rRNA (uracil1498-N3)-methyltransferase